MLHDILSMAGPCRQLSQGISLCTQLSTEHKLCAASCELLYQVVMYRHTVLQVEDESARQQHLIGYFKERNKNLKDENLELKERVCLLERLDLLSYSRDSVCMWEFKLHALKETY